MFRSEFHMISIYTDYTILITLPIEDSSHTNI